jgi:alpha-galactosidase
MKKTLMVTAYDQFPRMAFFDAEYANTGPPGSAGKRLDQSALLHRRSCLCYAASFWSYQSGSYQKRPDWVLPLKVGFQQEISLA